MQLTEASQKAPKSSDVWFALGIAYWIKMALIQDRGFVLDDEFGKALKAWAS